jgi:eukaryotic-like serine/threonine-protein kinase
MSYCINPQCPQNDRNDNQGAYCNSCGTALVLNGRYRVQRSLTNKEAAAGGFGYIYEILEGSQPKILKVLLFHHNNSPKAVELFQQEAKVLRNFKDNAGIPKIDGYFQHQTKTGMPLHCIVMEKIDGVTLEQWMQQQRNEPISETKALDWLEEIVKILALVHSQNYFHRDIKPANVMLRRSGELVLIDFGTAREMTASYLAKLNRGDITGIVSRGFTPPEQMNGEAVTQSDFFALGRTFAQLLTGRHPLDMYVGARDELIWRKYTQPNRTPELLDLFDKMMAKLAQDRHQNTAELLRDISRVRKIVKHKPVKPDEGMSRRDLLLLLGGSSFAAVVAWESLKPKPKPIIEPIQSPIPNPPSPVPETPRSSQNEPTPPSATPTPASRLQTQTLNNIITVDASGKEIDRRTVQVQYFLEDKISLPSGAKAIAMALIPAGNFTIGSPSTEKDRQNNESPQQPISFARPFYVSQYEVTQAQWFSVMGTDYDKDGFKKRFGELDNKFKGDNRPIVMVNWNDAKAYCVKLSEKTGRSYRLPTESEWEYSCRAKTTTPFYFGETITSDLVNHDSNYPYANVAKNSSGYRQVTTDVGSFPANEWGLYDMHGNVWEWCEDVWHENYNGIPQDGSAWLNGGEQARRLLRGGSWVNDAIVCRSAVRNWINAPGAYYYIGFRVAASVLS